MSFLHRTLKDGRVEIGINNFGCSLASFQKLFPQYKLDPQFVIREYIPNHRHKLQRKDGTKEYGPARWEEGDSYLKRVEWIEGWVAAAEKQQEFKPQELAQERITTFHPDGTRTVKSEDFSKGYRAGLAARTGG